MCATSKSVLVLVGIIVGVVVEGAHHGDYHSKKTQMRLVQAHVLFRHGQRITNLNYPTDPYINHTYYPISSGGLTNRGKMDEYKLGQFLRKKYNDLVSGLYNQDDIEVTSTQTERTIMSAQLVCAGLYPPMPEQQWHPELNWQPIPISYLPKEKETILHRSQNHCPMKAAIKEKLKKRKDIQAKFIEPYEELFRYVGENSGLTINSPYGLLNFYSIVKSEHDMNLKLPAWLHPIYPDRIYDVCVIGYDYVNSDATWKMLDSGYLMKKIIHDVSIMIKKNDYVKKMYLYSAHESNVAALLIAMNVFKPHVPSYGSAVMIELYHDQSDGEYFIKVSYRDGPRATTAVEFILPGCENQVYCPLKKFIELQTPYLPTMSIDEACKVH